MVKLSLEYLTRIFAYLFIWKQDWPSAFRFYIFWPLISEKKKGKNKTNKKHTQKKTEHVFQGLRVKALYFRTFETNFFVKFLPFVAIAGEGH